MSYGNEIQLNKHLPVVMSKDLAQARFTMDLWERRLMYVCMSKISNIDTTFPVIKFRIAEMAKLLDEKSFSNNEYAAVKKAAKKLVTRVVEIEEGTKYEIYNWVSYFNLDTNTNQISMQFNEYMKPYLLNLLNNKGYTKFLLKFALPLGSIYAQRFYEMFRCMVYEGQPKAVQRVQLDELRKKLDMPDSKYRNFHLFRLRVLDLAEREINQKTDIYISFKDIRRANKGRAVEALYISVILKADMIHEWDKYMLWQKDDLIEKLYEIVLQKKGQSIHKDRIEKYSHETIARLVYEIIEGVINLQDINNHHAFIEWQLNQWSTELGMNQLMIEDI